MWAVTCFCKIKAHTFLLAPMKTLFGIKCGFESLKSSKQDELFSDIGCHTDGHEQAMAGVKQINLSISCSANFFETTI
jgi:hypothetical protein